MSTMTKVFIVLTTLLAIVLSCLTVATAARWSNTREELDKFVQMKNTAIVERNNAYSALATGLAIKDDAVRARDRQIEKNQTELRRLTDELASTRSELAREKNEKVSAEAERRTLAEILDVQTAELTSLQKQNQVLLSENTSLQTRVQRMGSRLLEVTGELTIAGDQTRNLQEKLYAAEQRAKELQMGAAGGGAGIPTNAEVPPKVVAVSPTVAGPIRGEIANVDGRYVSLNVGQTSGVVEGMTFMVYRGSTYIGDVVIESVRPKDSGGKVAMEAPGQQVQSGDRVAYGLDQ